LEDLPMTIRVLLADDHRIVREGLASLIETDHAYAVVAHAESGREAVRLTRKLIPDIVIMDVSMPDLNGIDATRLCIEAVPSVKVIGLSIHADHRYVVGMLKAGASGYILKEDTFPDLLQAMDAACNHQNYLSPRVSGVLINDCILQLPLVSNDWDSPLSVKEREALQMIAEGHTTRQIATTLHLSVKAVESRRKSIMQKLNLHSVAQLTKYAIREGLTTLQEKR
jgi:two-component system response regulator NreC